MNHMSHPSSPEEHLPLSAADMQLLLILLDGDRHAYAIAKTVEQEGTPHVSLEIGSLYRILSRLSRWGLIDEGGTEPSPDGPRRKVYRITPVGREVVRAEAERLRVVLEVADARLRGAEG